MQDCNTIIGAIQMRLNNCPTDLSWIGTTLALDTLNLIMSRYKASEIPID